ncbi:hypothetical protein BGZ83_000502 [Gryganskiella cystojenkinii]|nr:hypothetical protein BGZ83_000502 [Gryganskiella cystojenkinii]
MSAPGPTVATILRSCPRLVSFAGHMDHQKPRSILLAIMEKHTETLESLKMRCDSSVPSALVLRLLSSCPALEVLDMLFSSLAWISDPNELTSAQIREYSSKANVFLDTTELNEYHTGTSASTPWLCERLKVLRISYVLDDSINPEESEEVFPRVLYERLGALSALEELRLKLIRRPPGPTVTNGPASDLHPRRNPNPKTEAIVGLKVFVDKAAVKKVRQRCKRIKWIQYSER